MARPKPRPSAESGELFPIRTVSHLTGVNSVTLRAWERRHGLIKPQRTPSGHRLYGPRQIEVIHRILGLLDKGLPISQVERALAAPGARSARAEQGPWNEYRESIVGRGRALRRRRTRGGVLAGAEPALDRDGDGSPAAAGAAGTRAAAGSPARAASPKSTSSLRSCATSWARAFITARARARGPRILAACLPDEQHELGLLIFSLAAHERGLRIVLLAAQTPMEELAVAARRARCNAIVLSSTLTPPAGVIAAKLPAMVEAAGVPVFVGGLRIVARAGWNRRRGCRRAGHGHSGRRGAHPTGPRRRSRPLKRSHSR